MTSGPRLSMKWRYSTPGASTRDVIVSPVDDCICATVFGVTHPAVHATMHALAMIVRSRVIPSERSDEGPRIRDSSAAQPSAQNDTEDFAIRRVVTRHSAVPSEVQFGAVVTGTATCRRLPLRTMLK